MLEEIGLIHSPSPEGPCALPAVSREAVDWEGFFFEHHFVHSGEYPEITHEEVVLVLTLDCYWDLTLPHKSELRFTSGDIFLAPAQAPHGARFQVTAEQVVMLLDPVKLKQVAGELLPNGSIELSERYRIRDPLVQQLMLALNKELISGQANGRLYTDALTNALVIHLLKTYSTSGRAIRDVIGEPSQQKLRRAIDYINDNLECDLSVADIAEAAGMNPYYFARLFKQAIGVPPHQFMIERRVEQAKVLLADTNLPLAEIGYRLGFSSQSHFSAIFRQLTAMTPKAYRKTL